MRVLRTSGLGVLWFRSRLPDIFIGLEHDIERGRLLCISRKHKILRYFLKKLNCRFIVDFKMK